MTMTDITLSKMNLATDETITAEKLALVDNNMDVIQTAVNLLIDDDNSETTLTKSNIESLLGVSNLGTDNKEIVASINEVLKGVKDVVNPLTYQKPIFTFIDDDGRSESYTRTYPIYKSYGISATFALVTGLVGTSGYMTTAQLDTLKADGFDFASHSATHDEGYWNTCVASTSDSTLLSEMSVSQTWLKTNGYGSGDNLVYPFANFVSHSGVSTEAVRIKNLAKQYYKHAVNADGWYNYSPNDNMYLNRYFVDLTNGDTLAKIKSTIDQCITDNGWLIFGIHAFNSSQFPDDTLKAVIEYIQGKSCTILNLEDALKYKANIVSEGEYTSSNTGFFVGRDGAVRNNAENLKIDTTTQTITLSTPLTSFAAGKLSTYNISSTNDTLDSAGGTLFTYSAGDYYSYQIFINYYGQKVYYRGWNSSTVAWNSWKELSKQNIAVSTNSYSGVLDSPPTYYDLNKITKLYVTSTHDTFKSAGGMLSIYHGASNCSYQTFEPISEYHVYKRVYNDTSSAWGTWTVIS